MHLARAQERRRSGPAGCIPKVVSKGGDNTLYQRLSTPRLAPKIVLNDVWKLEQQPQQPHDTLRSTRKPIADEENPPEADLRIPQDAVLLEGQGRMSNIQELVDKLRTGYQTESILADLGKT